MSAYWACGQFGSWFPHLFLCDSLHDGPKGRDSWYPHWAKEEQDNGFTIHSNSITLLCVFSISVSWSEIRMSQILSANSSSDLFENVYVNVGCM